MYEYIIFRGADIKDIRVCEPPKPQATLQGGLPNDPAIVKVRSGTCDEKIIVDNLPVQHSTSAAPGGPVGAKSHGPIGSGYGAIGSGPSQSKLLVLVKLQP